MDYLTPRDLQALRASRRTTARWFIPIIVFSAAGFLLVAVYWNVRFSAQAAALGGDSMDTVLLLWTNGIVLGESYPGTLVVAVDRLNLAIVQISLTFISTILGISAVLQNRRNQRIIDNIEAFDSEANKSA